MTEGSNSVVTLSELTAVVRRGSRVVVAAVVVGGLAGTALLAARPGRYATEALVEVRPIVSRQDDPNLDTARQINPGTEVGIAGSQRVAERALALRTAAQALGVTDFASLEVASAAAKAPADPDGAQLALANLTVSIVADSNILSFQAATDDPEQARAEAQSSAVAYLEFRRAEASAGAADSRLRLQQRQAELVSDLAVLQGGAPAGLTPDPAAGAVVGAGVGVAPVLAYDTIAQRQELQTIGTKYANLAGLTIDPGVVLTDAALPRSTEGLPFLAGPVMGALLGLIGALAAVFVLDRNNDRLRSSRVELGALGLPLLGHAPVALARTGWRFANPGDGGSAGQVYPSNSPAGDAYRRLQGSLVFTLDNQGKSVVLVAGVDNATAATTVAANLALTAARAGRRTLIVGADLRHNRLAAQFDLPAGQGLSDVVLDGASLVDAIRPVAGVEHLSVLSAGTRLTDPAGVLRNEALARLMAAVGADFDLVIVEAGPVLQVADAVDVAPLCDGSILVVDARSESRGAIADSVGQLRSVGSDVVGVVVADAAS